MPNILPLILLQYSLIQCFKLILIDFFEKFAFKIFISICLKHINSNFAVVFITYNDL